MPSTERLGKTLIWLKPQYLGDAVMALPLIDNAAELSNGIAIRSGPQVAEMLADRAELVDLLVVPKFKGFFELLKTVRALRKRRFQAALIVDRSFRSAIAVRLSGIAVRCGHATEGRVALLTHEVAYDPLRSEAESGLDLLRALGHNPVSHHPKLNLVQGELESASNVPASRFVAFQPGARYAEKQFPISSLAETAAWSTDNGYGIVALGGPDEVEASLEFKKQLGERNFIDLVGKTRLRETMAAMARASAMVGSDTGLLHIAAALGTPTVTVFGPNPASKWGHNYAPHEVLESPDGDPRRLESQKVIEALQRSLSHH